MLTPGDVGLRRPSLVDGRTGSVGTVVLSEVRETLVLLLDLF